MYKNRHGVKLIFLQTGNVGRFVFQTMVIQLVTAMGLLSVSAVLVDMLMLRIMPQRKHYSGAKFEKTDDFSDLRDRIKASASRRDLKPNGSRADLKSTGSRTEFSVRLFPLCIHCCACQGPMPAEHKGAVVAPLPLGKGDAPVKPGGGAREAEQRGLIASNGDNRSSPHNVVPQHQPGPAQDHTPAVEGGRIILQIQPKRAN
jgi:hypothetical protein